MGEAALWDRVDRAIGELHSCRGLEELTALACPLALAALRTPYSVLARISDGVWSAWRAAPVSVDALVALGLPTGPADVLALPFADAVLAGRLIPACGASPAAVPVRIDGTVVALLHVDLDDAGGLAAAQVYADALGAMYAVLDVRRRAAAQERAIAALAADLTPAGDDLIELFLPVGAELAGREAAAAAGRVRDRLTARQTEVLELVTLGLSNAEIADRLLVSVATVKSHVHKVLAALGAVNRTEAIAWYASAARSDPPGGTDPPMD